MTQKEKTKAEDKGLSGWLSPQGEFIPVDYGNHDKIARQLEGSNLVSSIIDIEGNQKLAHGERLLELLGYIKFVYRSVGVNIRESYVFFPHQFGYRGNITDEQIEWIEENYNNMSEYQQAYCSDFLYDANKRMI